MYVCSRCKWGYLMQHGRCHVKCGICGYTESVDEEKATQFMLLYKNGAKNVRSIKEDEKGKEISVGTVNTKGRTATAVEGMEEEE